MNQFNKNIFKIYLYVLNKFYIHMENYLFIRILICLIYYNKKFYFLNHYY